MLIRPALPWMATSSLSFEVSIPAVDMVVCAIVLDPSLSDEPEVPATIRVRRRGWRDQATLRPATAEGGTIRHQPPCPGLQPRAGHALRNTPNLTDADTTGWVSEA